MAIDIQMMDGKKTLYYLHWVERVGFIPMNKERYENKYLLNAKNEKGGKEEMSFTSKIKFEVEFPCGYKLKVDMESGMFQCVPCVDGLDECPLHGKSCPKGKKKNEKW